MIDLHSLSLVHNPSGPRTTACQKTLQSLPEQGHRVSLSLSGTGGAPRPCSPPSCPRDGWVPARSPRLPMSCSPPAPCTPGRCGDCPASNPVTAPSALKQQPCPSFSPRCKPLDLSACHAKHSRGINQLNGFQSETLHSGFLCVCVWFGY